MYAYSSFLGLPQGAYSAGYSWSKGKMGRFSCKLDSKKSCALYYYLNGFDFHKSLPWIADILLSNPERKGSFTLAEIERIAYQLYSMASSNDGYSLYTMA